MCANDSSVALRPEARRPLPPLRETICRADEVEVPRVASPVQRPGEGNAATQEGALNLNPSRDEVLCPLQSTQARAEIAREVSALRI